MTYYTSTHQHVIDDINGYYISYSSNMIQDKGIHFHRIDDGSFILCRNMTYIGKFNMFKDLHKVLTKQEQKTLYNDMKCFDDDKEWGKKKSRTYDYWMSTPLCDGIYKDGTQCRYPAKFNKKCGRHYN